MQNFSDELFYAHTNLNFTTISPVILWNRAKKAENRDNGDFLHARDVFQNTFTL